MRLTAFTDYGLRALMRPFSFSTNEIASEFGISRHHLTKVVRDLADNGFVATQRGVGGGFRLARLPNEITIGEVVRSLEFRHALVDCFKEDGGSCVLQPRCRLQSRRPRGRRSCASLT